MLIEHLVYSLANAIVFGAVCTRYSGYNYSWIIVASALSPDIDQLPKYMGYNFAIINNGIPHIYLHTLGALAIYALLFALLLRLFSLPFIHTFTFSAIGYGAHLFEDLLAYNPSYPFLWPLYPGYFGLGILPTTRDFYGIGNTETLAIGLFLIALAIIFHITTSTKRGINHRGTHDKTWGQGVSASSCL